MTETNDFQRLMQGVIPYLAIDGAEKAAAFYKDAFAARKIGQTVKGQDGRVMNIMLEINGGVMMMSDPFPEANVPAAQPATSQGLTLQLVVADADGWWARAVKAGCEGTQPVKLEFWGDRYGRVRDPFGLDWAFNEPGPGRNPA